MTSTSYRNQTAYDELHLVATTSGNQFEWFTDWQLATGVDTIRAVAKAKNATSANFTWQLAIQSTPVRTNNPNNGCGVGRSQIP